MVSNATFIKNVKQKKPAADAQRQGKAVKGKQWTRTDKRAQQY
jgi:hypothetical protein